MKRCPRCGEDKPVSEFGWKDKAKGWRRSYCDPCRAEYVHEHYVANKTRYVAASGIRNQKRRVDRTAWLIDYFASHPCVDCGETDPVVLDFDHLRDKEFNIGQELEYRSWDVVLSEIEKCEVRCANCHRRKTAERTGSLRALMAAERML